MTAEAAPPQPTVSPASAPRSPDPKNSTPKRGLGRGRIGRPGFSIQSKLLVMLLLVSVGASVFTGIVGYNSGTESLKQAAYERLIELRESRSREITNYYK